MKRSIFLRSVTSLFFLSACLREIKLKSSLNLYTKSAKAEHLLLKEFDRDLRADALEFPVLVLVEVVYGSGIVCQLAKGAIRLVSENSDHKLDPVLQAPSFNQEGEQL